MEKAFDLKNWIARLKVKGLPMLEQDAIMLLNVTLDWVEESIKLSDNKFDDLALMALPVVRQYAEKMAHKISPDATIVTETGEPQASNPIPTLPQA